MMERRRACWGVLIRVTPMSPWCCYGPATHREALEFRRLSVGTGIERQVVQLIPLPGSADQPRLLPRRQKMEKRYCSFCPKSEADVTRMVIGKHGQICDECVVKFYAEMNIQPEPNAPSPPESQPV